MIDDDDIEVDDERTETYLWWQLLRWWWRTCANSNMEFPQNERMLDVSDIVAILSSLYETISVKFSFQYHLLNPHQILTFSSVAILSSLYETISETFSSNLQFSPFSYVSLSYFCIFIYSSWNYLGQNCQIYDYFQSETQKSHHISICILMYSRNFPASIRLYFRSFSALKQ